MLDERGAYYCVPLPGETAWAREVAVAAGKQAKGEEAIDDQVVPATSARAKRGRDDDDVDQNSGEASGLVCREYVPSRRSRTSQKAGKASLAEGDKVCNADEFGLNFP